MHPPPPVLWPTATAIPPLAPKEIEIWRVNLAQPAHEISRLEKLLSAAEKKQAAAFRFERDQQHFILRRASLRKLLSVNLQLPPAEIEIESGNFQKPRITREQNPNELRFNCSHSGEVALIAMSLQCELGVDLEEHRDLPEADDLARNFFSETENNELQKTSGPGRLNNFFNCWTRKEAYVKAIGTGLSQPLNSFSVTLTPGESRVVLANSLEDFSNQKWSLISLPVAENYSAALVFSQSTSEPASLSTFELQISGV
jgi:4'-phosphopantetheinyl transferase